MSRDRVKLYTIAKDGTYKNTVKTVDDYKTMVKELRHVTTNFDKTDLRKVSNFTPQQKRQITAYYKKFRELSVGNKYIYRPRKKENLQAVQMATTGKLPGGFKVAFVDAMGGKPEIKVTKNKKVKIKKGGVRYKNYFFRDHFDLGLLLVEPENTITKFVKSINAKRYAIIMHEVYTRGSGGTTRTFTPDEVITELLFLLNTYGDSIEFVNGVRGYMFNKPQDFKKFTRKTGELSRRYRKR